MILTPIETLKKAKYEIVDRINGANNQVALVRKELLQWDNLIADLGNSLTDINKVITTLENQNEL